MLLQRKQFFTEKNSVTMFLRNRTNTQAKRSTIGSSHLKASFKRRTNDIPEFSKGAKKGSIFGELFRFMGKPVILNSLLTTGRLSSAREQALLASNQRAI